CFSEAAQAASLQNVDEVYVFGDSLSDVGNAFKATGGGLPPSPPYFRGRFSNGPVWVEALAPQLGVTLEPNRDFAFSGATTGPVNTLTPDLPGLQQQISGFTTTHPAANPNALYIVWAGANDYLGGTASSPTVPVKNLSAAVKSLAAVGAQNILVANLPDLGQVPATRTSPSSSTLSDLTQAHNLSLSKSLARLSQNLASETNIIEFDVYSLFGRARTAPGEFGFTNVTRACLDNFVVCDHPDKFLFWDGIHPTAAAHQLLGKSAAIAALRPQPIPEPTSVVGTLAFGALGAGALLKRKQKQKLATFNKSNKSI
ncbi:MAG TPA: PEP-CTERM sorting domain-containing protein, partial [Candidatus Caenarcaniphilales bacterium]